MNYSKEDIMKSLDSGIIYILDKYTIDVFLKELSIEVNVSNEIRYSEYIEVYKKDSKIVFENENIHLTFNIKSDVVSNNLATEKLNDITTEKLNLISV